MPICSLMGNMQKLSVGMRSGGVTAYGPLDDIEFFASGHEKPKKGPGNIEIFSEAWKSQESDLANSVAAGRMDQATADRLARMQSAAWINVFNDDQGFGYGLSVMLPRQKFEFFYRMVERHIGTDVGYLFSFDYPLFGSRALPTSAEFYAGKKTLDALEVDIDVTVRPGPIAREHLKQRK